MASVRKQTNTKGEVFYEIRAFLATDGTSVTKRWYVPKGWSQRSIDKELEKQKNEFERQCREGIIVSKSKQKQIAAEAQAAEEAIPTFSAYCINVFLPTKAITCSENTRQSFEGMIHNHLIPSLGKKKMPDITSTMITSVLIRFQSAGKAHATCVKLYNILHLIFKMAYLNDVIPRNPMDKVERPKPRKNESHGDEVESYSAEELVYIIRCLESEPIKWQAYMRLLIDTGVRRGEASGLQWKYVDFENNTITIAGNLCYTPSAGIYLDTPKNGKTRTIDVDSFVMTLLKQLRNEQAQSCISSFVFTQENSSEPMHPQSPTRFMQKFSARYGIENLHPHKLRHSFASVAITNGADIASVSEKLGHADKSTTLRLYTHADQESIRKASNIFRNALRAEKQA